MKYLLVFLLLFSFFTGYSQVKFECHAGPSIDTSQGLIVFIDSVNVGSLDALKRYNPKDINSIIVYKDTNAIKLIGPQGKNGVIFIETKKFARKRNPS